MILNDQVIAEINTVFDKEYECLGVLEQEPVIAFQGELEQSSSVSDRRLKELDFISRTGRRNEPQFLAEEELDLSSNPAVIPVYMCDYATVRAMRALGDQAGVLGGGVLALCVETEEIFLQMRSASSDLNPSRLNTFTGAYHSNDNGSLIENSLREFEEETGLRPRDLSLETHPPAMALCRHIVWRTLELILLGVPLSHRESRNLRDTPEGEIVTVKFRELGPLLTGSFGNGTSACLQHVIIWLACGAPPIGSEMKLFAGMTSSELLDSSLEMMSSPTHSPNLRDEVYTTVSLSG